jgi:hypothetical protein
MPQGQQEAQPMAVNTLRPTDTHDKGTGVTDDATKSGINLGIGLGRIPAGLERSTEEGSASE